MRRHVGAVVMFFRKASFMEGKVSFWGTSAEVLSVALPTLGGAVLGAALSGSESVDWIADAQWWLSSLGILLGIQINVKAKALQGKRESALRASSQGDVRRSLDKISVPVRVLEKLAASEQSEKDCKAYFESIAECGASLLKDDDLRVCIYKFEAQEVDDEAQNENVELVKLRADGGRPDHPRSYFDSTTPEGRKFIQSAKGHTPVVTNDPDNDGINTNKKKGSQWNSYMVVPVRGETGSYGAVSIDSRRKMAFTELHEVYGSVIAQFVAAGEQVSQAAVEDVIPEKSDALKLLSEIEEARSKFQHSERSDQSFDDIWNILNTKGEED